MWVCSLVVVVQALVFLVADEVCCSVDLSIMVLRYCGGSTEELGGCTGDGGNMEAADAGAISSSLAAAA